jgi:hypothetical protein
VVQDNVKLAEEIFGRDIAILKGKTTRKKPKPVIHDTIAVPKALKSAQEEVTLSIDTFFVNRLPFLHTISDKIHYRTSQWCQTVKQAHIECTSKWCLSSKV